MADPNDTIDAKLPHPLSGDYAALAEMTYRRADDANSTHIDTLDGITSLNPLTSPQLQAAANTWQEGADVKTWIREEYGLTIDPKEGGDGLTHFYTQNGFSGYMTLRDNGAEQDQLIITYRGTDMADNAEEEMMSGIVDAAGPLLAPAARGAAGVDWARNAHPSPEEYRAAIAEATGKPFEDFTVDRKADGTVLERLVDAGDIYTNGLLGQGTYQETQYDDAKALYRLANDHLTPEGQEVVVAGQSLGGGLAALVGLEHDLEIHTFGMAPFQNQFEIIAERNAVSDMLSGPESGDVFGGLAAEYQMAALTRQNQIERELADQMDNLAGMNLTPGGHTGKNVGQAINRFNDMHGTQIDRNTLIEFREQRAANAAEYENNKPDPSNPEHEARFYASTVGEEFTTNAGEGSLMGGGVMAGSAQIIPTEQLHRYDLGPNQTADKIRDIRETQADGGRMFPGTGQLETLGDRGIGEGLSTHSPALNDLVVSSQNSSVGGFDSLLADNPNLRYSVLHRTGLMGSVAHGKVGQPDDPSASRSEAPTNETVYRALSNSLRIDGELYEHTVETLRMLGTEGRSAEGVDADYPAAATLNGSVNQFALQRLRVVTQGLKPGKTISGKDIDFAGTLNEDGLAVINIEALDPVNDMNRVEGPNEERIAGLGGIHGYNDLQTVIYDTVRDQVELPNDQGFFESDNHATARVTDEILGTSLDFRNLGRTEGKLNIPDGEIAIGQLYVQTGKGFDGDLNLTNEAAGEVSGQLGTAIFMGVEDNHVLGSNRRDFAMLGGGADTYTSQVEGGAIISGNTGYDTYSVASTVGPVSAMLTENTLQVVQNTNLHQMEGNHRNVADTAVGVEHYQLTHAGDTIHIKGLSGEKLLDGLGGGDSVDYRRLDNDFKLYTEDGVTKDGIHYSSRISDGETTLFIRGVDDENISRTAPVPTQRVAPSENVQEASNTDSDIKELLMKEAVTILRDETSEALSLGSNAQGVSNAAVDGMLNSPAAVSVMKTLVNNEQPSIPVSSSAMEGNAYDRVSEVLKGSVERLDEIGKTHEAESQFAELQNDEVSAGVTTPSNQSKNAYKQFAVSEDEMSVGL